MSQFDCIMKQIREAAYAENNEYPNTDTEIFCSCGCLENDDIYKMLQTAGRFSPEFYLIAFKTGQLSITKLLQ
jgi:hypothetical protein